MKRELGFGFCGLACCVCSENVDCPGCRQDGCRDKDSCKNFRCCKEKGLDGCWECAEFPCGGTILDKVRVRAFGTFLREYGAKTLLDCLERNERQGVSYHDPGKLTGDYDMPETELEIIDFIVNGSRPAQ